MSILDFIGKTFKGISLILFFSLWGWTVCLSVKFMGWIGAVLSVILTPVVMAVVVLIHEAIVGHWAYAFSIVGLISGFVIFWFVGIAICREP